MNLFQQLIAQTIESGVSQETVILFLLLPLVAGVVAAIRHLIGFHGFGILIPTAIALTLAVTGISAGLLVFLTILLTATLARSFLSKLRLHYLPRMALVLWFVTVAVLVLIFVSPIFKLGLTKVSIFPVLILILLAEEFISVQIGKSLREATRLTAETIIIALSGYFIFNLRPLQEFALRQPHWIILAPLVLNLLVGRFSGLRLLEYLRFKKLLN